MNKNEKLKQTEHLQKKREVGWCLILPLKLRSNSKLLTLTHCKSRPPASEPTWICLHGFLLAWGSTLYHFPDFLASPTDADPSIHPLSFAYLGSIMSGYSVYQSPWQQFPSSPGRSWGVPKPDEISNPFSEFWVYPGSPGKPPKCSKCPRHPDQIQLSSLFITTAQYTHWCHKPPVQRLRQIVFQF